MSDKRRQQLLIDNEVQIDLVWQSLRFWVFGIITVGLFLCIGAVLFGEQQTTMGVVNEIFFKYGGAAVASIIVLPLVLMDVFRHSNRFAGPIYRLRAALRRLAEGERIGPIHFRDDDYWHDLADDFNRALEKLQGPEPIAAGSKEAAPVDSAEAPSPVSFDDTVREVPTFPVVVSSAASTEVKPSSPTMVG